MAHWEYHDTLPDSVEMLQAAEKLKIQVETMMGYHARLYSAFIRHAPGGIMSESAALHYSNYRGKRDFIGVLVEQGFLARCAEGVEVVDWESYTRGYRRARAEAERLANKRANSTPTKGPTVGPSVAMIGSDRNGTDQNRTEQIGAEDGPLSLSPPDSHGDGKDLDLLKDLTPERARAIKRVGYGFLTSEQIEYVNKLAADENGGTGPSGPKHAEPVSIGQSLQKIRVDPR